MSRSGPLPSLFTRRSFLIAGTGAAAGLICATVPFSVVAQETAIRNGGFDEFMRISAWLTGHEDLDPAQGQTAFQALSARFPDFDQGLERLAAFLDDEDVEAARLQTALDEAGVEFVWVPRQIVSAWYLGVVGAVEQPADAAAGLTPPAAVEGAPPLHAIAWEQALMFAPLAGTIPIPSYVYRGNWAEEPGSGE